MNSTKTNHATERHHTRADASDYRVQAWPRLKAVVNPDGTGTLIVNGTHHPCKAASVDALRTGMTARAVTYARTLRRPVRMDVTDGPDAYRLAIRPEGYVQLLSDTGTINLHENLLVSEGPCRRCGHAQPVTLETCSACDVREPFSVKAPTGAERQASPERETVTEVDALAAVGARARQMPTNTWHLGRALIRRRCGRRRFCSLSMRSAACGCPDESF